MGHGSKVRRFFKTNTLRWQIITFCIIVVFILGSSGYSIYFRESNLINNYNTLMENILLIQQLNNSIDNNKTTLKQYKDSGSRIYIAQLSFNKETLASYILNLNSDVSNKDIKKEINNLKNYITNYDEDVRKLIFSSEQDRQDNIFQTENLLKTISLSANKVYSYQIDEVRYKYKEFNDSKKGTQLIATFAFVAIILLCLVTVFLYTNKLLKPVKILTIAATQISEGSFDIPELKENIKTEEFRILTSTFVKMTLSIKEYINELNAKVDLERKLKVEELNNERNRLLLKEAELMLLQSQVNPHFMFNTLNTIAKIAYTEDAERTASMIEAMSKLLRYSLRSLKKVVTLEEEISSMEEYIYIQRTRFGDRLKFIKEIDSRVLNIEIPCLTIQPLVENAVIHGIENKEEGGWVKLSCFMKDEYIIITIKDNGVGMSQKTLQDIINKRRTPNEGHTTGLGVNNVRERLELMYGRNDVFEIFSEEGVGTEVRIKLPQMDLGGEI